jgi:hypothetical protein
MSETNWINIDGSRRNFLWESACGFGAIALQSLLRESPIRAQEFTTPTESDLAPNHLGRAKPHRHV